MINVNIEKDQDENISFNINDDKYKFNYEGFEKLIDLVIKTEDKISVADSVEDLKEYKKLLEEIIEGVQQEDFKTAVEEAKKNTLDLEELEKQYSE